MVASNMNAEFEERLTDRFLARLCEAAELVITDMPANRLRLRELLDDLAFELDAGDLALCTLQKAGPYPTSTGRQMSSAREPARN